MRRKYPFCASRNHLFPALIVFIYFANKNNAITSACKWEHMCCSITHQTVSIRKQNTDGIDRMARCLKYFPLKGNPNIPKFWFSCEQYIIIARIVRLELSDHISLILGHSGYRNNRGISSNPVYWYPYPYRLLL